MDLQTGIPASVDNMNPRNRFIQTLAAIPMSSRRSGESCFSMPRWNRDDDKEQQAYPGHVEQLQIPRQGRLYLRDLERGRRRRLSTTPSVLRSGAFGEHVISKPAPNQHARKRGCASM